MYNLQYFCAKYLLQTLIVILNEFHNISLYTGYYSLATMTTADTLFRSHNITGVIFRHVTISLVKIRVRSPVNLIDKMKKALA